MRVTCKGASQQRPWDTYDDNKIIKQDELNRFGSAVVMTSAHVQPGFASQ